MADGYEFMDVDVITIPLEDGSEMECAIIDEFEFEGQGYIVLSPIEDETVKEDMFLYRCTPDGDDMVIDYIDDEEELDAVAAYYEELLEELE